MLKTIFLASAFLAGKILGRIFFSMTRLSVIGSPKASCDLKDHLLNDAIFLTSVFLVGKI
jgi:hypothetical protein